MFIEDILLENIVIFSEFSRTMNPKCQNHNIFPDQIWKQLSNVSFDLQKLIKAFFWKNRFVFICCVYVFYGILLSALWFRWIYLIIQ